MSSAPSRSKPSAGISSRQVDPLPARSFRALLEPRGYTVLTVGAAFPSGSSDEAVLVLAESLSAVVISTDRDWRGLLSRVRGSQGRIRRAGRILFNCRHDQVILRLERLLVDIEREYDSAIAEGRTLMIRITESTFTIEK